MLELEIMTEEGFDEDTNRFVPVQTVTIELEHSLLSLAAWESKWEKPFLKDAEKHTPEQYFDYFVKMCLNPEDAKWLNFINQQNISEINEYINSKQSAAWFNERNQNQKPGGRGTVITADLIYYWMAATQIPFIPCQEWHLNRLLTLIRIAELESRPKKKMSKQESMAQHRSINARRRAMSGNGG